jgi:hypothetical protein
VQFQKAKAIPLDFDFLTAPIPCWFESRVKDRCPVKRILLGFPNLGLQGFAPKLAKGEIASLSGAGDDARYFQISVPVQPGNSGLRRAVVVSQGNSSRGTHARLTTRE